MSGKPWTESELKQLRKQYGVMKTRKLAEKLGRRYDSTIAKANSLGLRTRALYTEAEKALIRAEYPTTPTKVLAEKLGKPEHNLQQWARHNGIHKTSDYKAALYAKQAERLAITGKDTRLQPGLIPWNRGQKGICADGCQATQFKPGQVSPNSMPIGSESVRKDGYVTVKVADTGRPWQRWRCKHVVLWEAAHGPVPDGYAVYFRNDDRHDFRLDNLELITRCELKSRTHHTRKYPAEILEVIKARTVLTRIINNRKRGQQREEQARRPA